MFKPMLARNYLDYLHRVVFPAAIQPKLNGVRMCSSKGNVYSRSGKPLRLCPQLKKQITTLRHLELDGELYLHGYHLDQIRGNAKRLVSKKLDLELKFHVFDLFNETDIFDIRQRNLGKIPDTSHIVIVPTYLAKSDEEVRAFLKSFLKKGYEGVIIRNPDSLYQQKRTTDLLRLKPWIRVTAIIVGFIEGKGKYEGTLGAIEIKYKKWSCKVGSGLNDKQRDVIWANKKSYLGLNIVIKYLELTSLGNPHSPIFQYIPGSLDMGICS